MGSLSSWGSAPGEYSGEDDNQLQPEDTLIDRGVDDMLDEGYSPPERPYGRGAYGPSETMDQMLAEEEPDPASQIGNPLLDKEEQRRSDESEREIEFPRHDARLGVCERADLSRRTGVLAKMRRRS